ncbi:MAG: type II secretion system F family protein [Thermoleophilaceae bacterium]|nr:type II secretion system F family protein [Thermoleophilaceae bacterium]
MTAARTAAVVLSAAAAAMAVCGVGALLADVTRVARLGGSRQRARLIARQLLDEGRIHESFGGRRFFAGSLLIGIIVGFTALGGYGIPIGMALAPVMLRAAVRSRRRRYAARIDACAAEFALALASSLAAGRSVRGALLTAGVATPGPLADELDRAAVDLTLGGGIPDALASLRSRTNSARIESLAGAIELHRGSGGDLVRLMRELADAFRARDRALRDAHSASAQARFTAIVVAAIPIVTAAGLELFAPGLVTGALTLLPTAMMLALSLALMAVGVLLAHRLGGAAS